MSRRVGAVALLLAMLLPWPLVGNADDGSSLGRLFGGSRTIKDCDVCPELVVLPTGSFIMGSSVREAGRFSDEDPRHIVIVNTPVALGKTPVTQGQWKAIMGSNPSLFWSCGNDCPVEYVSWYDAREFLSRLSARTGQRYRLPSEAEWEYACRAGGQNTYCGSDNPDDVAWYDDNSGGRTHPVGQKAANAFGLYDMNGNVWEWVQDCYHANFDRAPANGDAWTDQTVCTNRVLRGGSWSSTARSIRAAKRAKNSPETQSSYDGFRVARSLP